MSFVEKKLQGFFLLCFCYILFTTKRKTSLLMDMAHVALEGDGNHEVVLLVFVFFVALMLLLSSLMSLLGTMMMAMALTMTTVTILLSPSSH